MWLCAWFPLSATNMHADRLLRGYNERNDTVHYFFNAHEHLRQPDTEQGIVCRLFQRRYLTSSGPPMDSCISPPSRDADWRTPPGNEYIFTSVMELKSVMARTGLGAMDSTWSEDGHDGAAMSPPEDVTVCSRIRTRSPSILSGLSSTNDSFTLHAMGRLCYNWWEEHQPNICIVVARTGTSFTQKMKVKRQCFSFPEPCGAIHLRR